MALTPGSFVGSYEITGLLGVGGMGEVYSARDSKLERRVAIKVLPPALAEDPERRKRFEREARLLAALNHPNIAVIHGLEDGASATQSALVMELVEGPTLADRLASGALPLEEALPIAKQIAEALEAAHEQGIVHRDLKPANIKLRHDGGVKVLDFGLAKALTPDPSAPTARAALTSLASSRPGFVLGTAAYMSPEQARGASVDESADLWAFGCVLYEMLTGVQAFAGEDTTDIIAAVVRSEPDWSKLPMSTPLLVRTLLKQCSRKQPRHRLADARSARLMIEEAIAAPVAAEATTPRDRGRLRWTLLAGVACATAVLTALGAWLLLATPEPERAVTRALLSVEPAAQLAPANFGGRPSRRMMTLSPDGRTLVFAALPDAGRPPPVLYRRGLDEAEAVPLTGLSGIVPFFSPDGAWIAFWGRDGVLLKAPSAGGPPEVITQLPPGTGPTTPWGESWATDGTIVFSAEIYSGGQGIFRVSANGGAPERLTTIDAAASEKRHLLPHVLPGNRTLLYTAEIDTGGAPDTVVVAARLDTGERRVLLERAADARYVPSGHLLFMRSGTLMAAGFDPARVELTTGPVAVLADVAQSIGAYNSRDESYEGQFVVAANGTLLYLTGGLYPLRRTEMVWIDRDGKETPLLGDAGEVWGPRLAPDGKRIAFIKRTRQMFRNSDIWIYDLERATERPVTFDGTSVAPAWSPDGRELVFTANVTDVTRRRLLRMPADGGTPTPIGNEGKAPTSAWSKALDSVAFVTNDAGTRQIWVQPLGVDAEPTLVTQGPYELMDPVFSPDGRWLAYVSAETGNFEIYVQPYDVPGEKVRISSDGGIGPIWAPDGRELFYASGVPGGGSRMMAVDVDLTAGFRTSRPRQLFAGPYGTTLPLRNYDYDANGRRFVMMKTVFDGPPPVTQMHIVLNWLDELRRRVPVAR